MNAAAVAVQEIEPGIVQLTLQDRIKSNQEELDKVQAVSLSAFYQF